MESEKAANIVELAATLASRAEEFDEVLVVYTRKDNGEGGSIDNGLTVSQANFLVDKFKMWLFQCIAKEKDGR